MLTLIRLLAVDDSGQDMIEYALLTAFIGLAGAATLQTLGVTIGNTFNAWNTNNNSLWESPNPQP